MKLAITLLLCAVTANLANKPDGKADKHGNTSKDAQNPTITFVDNRTSTPEEKPAEQKTPEWYATSVAAEWALFFVGVGGIITAIYSLKAINRQITEMREQGQLMFGQLRAMHEQISEMSAQTDVLERSVAVAKESADAAKVNADIAAGVSVPTLVVEKFEVGDLGAASLTAYLQFPHVNIVVKNCGQTPAFLKWWTIVFTAEELPDIPVYNIGPARGMLLEKEIVEPNASYTLPKLYYPYRTELSLDDGQAIINRQKMLTVYGFICYGDIFGNPLRRLKFCEFALNLFDGPHPTIQWTDCGDAAYSGTDRVPLKKSSTRQSDSADAKTDDHSKKAN